ncbi:hypothetical protein C8T65DRAFT_108006 [Cerioporus squamosus]|nr:hypothetical protein C8T65DRAFT_108006 [Cerioporus squamosus]
MPMSGISGEESDLADIFAASRTSACFWFKRFYPVFPNPLMCLDDYLAVGLPVTACAADDVKCRAARCQCGHGHSDSEAAAASWVVDATQITCENSAWTGFLVDVASQVCEVLGVGLPAVAPAPPRRVRKPDNHRDAHRIRVLHEAPQANLRLRSLLLSDPDGSCSGSCLDLRPASGFNSDGDDRQVILAKVAVALPSSYEGGKLRISHGTTEVEHDLSIASSTALSIIAWRLDDFGTTVARMDPVARGSRVLLVYDLVQDFPRASASKESPTVPAPVPLSLPVKEDVLAQLERALLSWKSRDPQADSEKIVYLLEGTYARTNLSARCLKGSDAHLVALLDNVASPLGFCLGLASVRGMCVGVYRGGDEMEMLGVTDRSTSVEVENLVNLDGTFVREQVMTMLGGHREDVAGAQILPLDFVHDLFSRDVAEEQVGTISETAGYCAYHGTVLVLWQ